MSLKEIQSKSLLRKQKRVDSWFLSRYGMNLYRGCVHNCLYCDGRSEGYYVEGEFGKDVAVKVNGAELLNRELDPRRKRKPLKKAYVMIGGGVGDAYQPADERYALARKCLNIVSKYNFPVHVLTKSSMVERDMDMIQEIDQTSGAIVSMSFSCVDDGLAKTLEPGCSPPSRRLKTLAAFRRAGIATGMFLMPVIPFLTDGPKNIDSAVAKAKAIGVDFVVFSGMTLKPGGQWDYFMKRLKRIKPDVVEAYHSLYSQNRWGSPHPDYVDSAMRLFNTIASHYQVNQRIPPRLYRDIVDENDKVVVMLEHLDYFNRANGMSSPYRFAAQSVAKLKEPISGLKDVRTLYGVGGATASVIKEILKTGTSSRLEALLK